MNIVIFKKKCISRLYQGLINKSLISLLNLLANKKVADPENRRVFQNVGGNMKK